MSARRRGSVTASSLGPSCLASRVAAGCTCPFYTPHHARTPPTRVAAAFRTAHLHSGPIARTKFRRAFNAPIIATGRFFDLFGPPQIWVGVGPLPGSAVRQLVVVWQAKKAVAEKKAADEEAEKVPCSPALDGFGLRRTASATCACVEWRHRFHSHTSALCRTTRRATARARA
jgi:hypothetical protein